MVAFASCYNAMFSFSPLCILWGPAALYCMEIKLQSFTAKGVWGGMLVMNIWDSMYDLVVFSYVMGGFGPWCQFLLVTWCLKTVISILTCLWIAKLLIFMFSSIGIYLTPMLVSISSLNVTFSIFLTRYQKNSTWHKSIVFIGNWWLYYCRNLCLPLCLWLMNIVWTVCLLLKLSILFANVCSYLELQLGVELIRRCSILKSLSMFTSSHCW